MSEKLKLTLTLTLNPQSTKLQSVINSVSYYTITITMYEMELSRSVTVTRFRDAEQIGVSSATAKLQDGNKFIRIT